uniref:WD repeat-containing protein 75 second beta-propeller domain-containing protein n=1 Tax=Phlebotomus papatasi TaxID=29031 RepID=A0A1B0DFN8_PHLPP
TQHPFKVSLSNSQKIFAVIQRHVVNIGNLSTGKRRFHFNPDYAFFTTVAIHPTAPVIATGDNHGKVILWRNTDDRVPVTTRYHWHSGPVKCLAFTESGTHFFSGGIEYVLVKWTHNHPEQKNFLPRMRGSPVHISVGPQNQQIAVALNDNGIQLLDGNLNLRALIQNFSHVARDNTEELPFPAGLTINPRNNSIVLNGRVGYLQFFSPQTGSFLYDIDVTGENQLAPEPMSIIYNTRVTKVALCLDWMATAECWDDHENFAQVRLKFWAFSREKQLFELNTNIQWPHEKAITALEFSGIYSEDRVVCASAGGDNYLMTWVCEGAQGTNPRWVSSGRVSYKNYPIRGLAFSQDGSLLAGGFGNICVVYTTDELVIKAIFSAPSGLDGAVAKVSIYTPKVQLDANGDAKPKKKFKKADDQQSKAIKLIQSFLDKSSNDLVKFVKNDSTIRETSKSLKKSSQIEDEDLFYKIMTLNDLNLDQKLEVLRQLEIYCKVGNSSKEKLREFFEKSQTLSANLDILTEQCAALLGENCKYSKNSYLWNLKKRRQFYHKSKRISNTKLSKIFFGSAQTKFLENGNRDCEESENEESPSEELPLTELAEIEHVAFSTGEHAHLLIVSTKNRVLIWNLLTLKLKSILRVAAVSLKVDPITGLFAVITKHNNLYIFFPNTPIPLYHRRDLPNIYDAVWIPRQDPKATSLSLDWQANSQLFFLTDKQELVSLVSRNDDDGLTPMVTFLSEANTVNNYTPFGAMIAKQMQQKVRSGTGNTALPIGILGKSNVNEVS